MSAKHTSTDVNHVSEGIELSTLGEQNAASNSLANDEVLLERDREVTLQGQSHVESETRIEEPRASTSRHDLEDPIPVNETAQESTTREHSEPSDANQTKKSQRNGQGRSVTQELNTVEKSGVRESISNIGSTGNLDQDEESGSKRQCELMGKMLTVLENLDKKLESVDKKLENMDKKLETLEKNSKFDHDDQPFSGHDLRTHEPAWRAVYETISVTMKDKVDRWKSGMDSSLIFVGLFVTIITAFLVPVLQNLAPNPSDLTNTILTNLTTIIYEIAVMNGMQAPAELAQPEPFHPALSDEIVLLFLYAALLLSLIIAIFSVFGRQWVEDLTKKPEGETYKEKSQRVDLREELSNKILKPVLDSLHPILILSITFFIVGLLYQLWTKSVTVDKSVTLILTSSVGSGLVLCATIVTVGTVLHGSYCDESPFAMWRSAMIRRLLPKRFLEKFKVRDEREVLLPLVCKSITQMDDRENYDHASTVRLFQYFGSGEEPESSTINCVLHFLESDASQKAKLTMAWNLLDLLKLEKNDYERLINALESLERDTPPNQDKIRVGFLFVRMVLRLRSNNKEVFVNASSIFLDKEDMKEVFMKIHALRGPHFEKYEVAIELAELAKEDSHVLDDIKEELLDLILNVDNSTASPNWREYIFPVLLADDVTEVLRRISQKTENYNFYFKILGWILDNCKDILRFPDDFNLSNLIAFLSTYEDRYNKLDQTFAHFSPTEILFLYCKLMDNALLSRQKGLPEFLEKSIEDIPRETRHEILRDDADSLLKRLRILPVENAALLEHEPSSPDSLVE